MELIDIFFYKLSRLIYSIWDQIVEYFNGTPFYEKIYLGILALIIIIILVVINRLVLRRSFEKRAKKYGLLEFKYSEEKPSENEIVEEETVQEQKVQHVTKVEKDSTTVQQQKSIVYLSQEIEELISERIDDLALKLEDTILTQIKRNSDYKNIVEQDKNEMPVIQVEDQIIEEEIPESEEDTFDDVNNNELDIKSADGDGIEPIDEVILDSVDELIEEEPEVELEEIIEEQEKISPMIKDDFDPFFDKDTDATYIVSKHPISGWQIKKVGAKRASRLFNTKKQAINYAIKQKYEYDIK